MSVQRFIFGGVAVLLSFGVSSAAISADCAEGFIVYERVQNINIDGQDCFIHNVFVEGNVNAQNGASLTMIDNTINGKVTIKNYGSVSVVGNTVNGTGDALKVNENTSAAVALNISRGNILVNRNVLAIVNRNRTDGNLICTANGELDDFGNDAAGEEECSNNL